MDNLLSDDKARPMHEGDIGGLKIIYSRGTPLEPFDPGSVSYLVKVLAGEEPVPKNSHAWLLNPLGRLLCSWIFNPNRLRANSKENKLFKACMAQIKTIATLRELILDIHLQLLSKLTEDGASVCAEMFGSLGSYSMSEEFCIQLFHILLEILGFTPEASELSDEETLSLLGWENLIDEIEKNPSPEEFKWVEPKRKVYQLVDPPGDPVDSSADSLKAKPKLPAGGKKDDKDEKDDKDDDFYSLENVFKRAVWSLSDIQSDTDATASAFTLRSYGPESDVYAYGENNMLFDDIMNDAIANKSLKAPPFRAALRMLLCFIHGRVPTRHGQASNKNSLPAVGPGRSLEVDFSLLAQLDPALNFIVGLANERVLLNVDAASRLAFAQLCEINEGLAPFPTISTLRHLWASTMPAGMSQVLVLSATFLANRTAPDNGLKGIILPPGNEKFYEGLRAASSVLKSSSTARGPISLTRTFMDAPQDMRARLAKLPNLLRVTADMALMQLGFGQLTSIEFEEKHLEEFGQLKPFELASIGWAHLNRQSLTEAADTLEKLSAFSFVWSQLGEKDYLAQPRVIMKALVAPGIHDIDALILKISALTALEPAWVSKKKPAQKKKANNSWNEWDWGESWKGGAAPDLKKQKTGEENVKLAASKAIWTYWDTFNATAQHLPETEKEALCQKYKHVGLRVEERGILRANKTFCTFALFGQPEKCPFGESCTKEHDIKGETIKI